MTENTHQILCGVCEVAPQPIPDTEPQRWRCPVCGVDDAQEAVIREAGEHARDVVARDLQEKARDVGRKVAWIKVTAEPIPERAFRWISRAYD